MTTVAWDGKTLAADKACWNGNEVWSPFNKLFRVNLCGDSMSDLRLSHPKIVWAATGYCHVLPLVLSWMEKGGDRPRIDKDETGTRLGLVLEVDTGKIYGITGLMTLVPYPSGPVAEGGGHEMALGAMLAGASAAQAINIVASRSSWAAGGVDSFTLPDNPVSMHDAIEAALGSGVRFGAGSVIPSGPATGEPPID
jgi:hypothetical protein